MSQQPMGDIAMTPPIVLVGEKAAAMHVDRLVIDFHKAPPSSSYGYLRIKVKEKKDENTS